MQGWSVDDLAELYSKSRQGSYLEYLRGRGLSDFGDVGRVALFLFRERVIKDSLLLFIRDMAGNIVEVLSRGMDGTYSVVYRDAEYIALYNVRSVLANTLPVVLCESVLDVESIRQNIGFIIPISFGTAAVSNKAAALLNLLLYERCCYICFDNDFGGGEQSKRIISLSERYGNRFRVLDVPYKDVNDFLVHAGREKFIEHFREKVL
jgi:DNA primase